MREQYCVHLQRVQRSEAGESQLLAAQMVVEGVSCLCVVEVLAGCAGFCSGLSWEFIRLSCKMNRLYSGGFGGAWQIVGARGATDERNVSGSFCRVEVV